MQHENEGRKISLNRGHIVYINDDGSLTFEWYDFGDDAPGESATLINFNACAKKKLYTALSDNDDDFDNVKLLSLIADKFRTYWEAKEFATAHNIDFTRTVDFMP